MNIIPSKPIWGETLKPGYCGFITREKDLVGDGIEWFERFDSGVPFCHAFVIHSPQDAPMPLDTEWPYSPTAGEPIQIVEAHARTGVRYAELDQYLTDPNCQCFIRVPFGYTSQIGVAIAQAAADHIGDKYGYGLIIADLLANTYLGRAVNSITANIPDRIVCNLFTKKHYTICSELDAEALRSQHYLSLLGCLKNPPNTIMPADLGNDDSVFQPTAFKIS